MSHNLPQWCNKAASRNNNHRLKIADIAITMLAGTAVETERIAIDHKAASNHLKCILVKIICQKRTVMKAKTNRCSRIVGCNYFSSIFRRLALDTNMTGISL